MKNSKIWLENTGNDAAKLCRNVAGIALIVFFSFFFTACRNSTTCLPGNGSGGTGGGSNNNPNIPIIPTCIHNWGIWERTGFYPLQETTRICYDCGAVDVFTPFPGSGGTISGGGTGGRVKYTNILCAILGTEMDMVWIPAGSIYMGFVGSHSADLQPPGLQRENVPSGFYMSRTEVTRRQWRAIMPTEPAGWSGLGDDDWPANHVSFFDILVFANELSDASGLIPAYEIEEGLLPNDWTAAPNLWGAVPTSANARWNAVRINPFSNGYRLPTGLEWEYACRAGTITDFNDGVTNWVNNATTNPIVATELAFLNHPPIPIPFLDLVQQPVGQRRPNAWGLYGMHGHVREWLWNPSGNSRLTSSNLSIGAAGNNGHAIRSSSRVNDTYSSAHTRFLNIGFRLIRPAN